MKKIMIGALAILAITAPLAAVAAPKDKPPAAAKAPKVHTTAGIVASWAPTTRMLELKNGSKFKVDDKITGAAYTAGQNVSVSWENKDGAKLAESVTVK